MNRFLTIQNNRLVAERHALEIVEGEIEATEEFDGAEVGMILLDGVWQKDPQEIAEQIKQNRIIELKQIIENKNYLGDDVTAERAELRELLGL
jgi:hypothetical protein